MVSAELQGSYAYSTTNKIVYGPGCLKDALPKLISALGATKALVVTGKTLHTKTNVIQRVEEVLKAAGVSAVVFDDIGEHSPEAGINAGVDAFTRASADFIVSVGGGSPIDASKVMAYRIHERDAGQSREGVKPFIRQIAVPTTLSVAETTPFAGYTDAGGEKVAVYANDLAPFGIIYDAQLTLATPERLWLSSGMRALDHAVENLYRPGVPFPIKCLCYQAIADLFTYLPKSKASPNDVEARQKLQIASWMSLFPIAFDDFFPIGLSHALGHRLGAKYHIPHGMTSCLTLGVVVALQASIATPDDKRALARAISHLHIPTNISVEADIRNFGAEIVKLVYNLGLECRLSAYGVPKDDLPKIAAAAVSRAKTGEDRVPDVVEVLESIY